jgi:hypothetical protein
MILDRHPDQPGRRDGRKYIGYWHSIAIDPKTLQVLPYQGLEFVKYEMHFGKAGLPLPSEAVDSQWDPHEKALVLAYLRVGKTSEQWKGYSWCRFGCKGHAEMGTTDLTDGTYVWPEGFAHYIEHHGVRPPQEFIDHVHTVRMR